MRPRRAVSLGLPFALAFVMSFTPPVFAQNENETVGFRPTHAFEAGSFGETIDTLNGGLNLSVPIGPSYHVNDRLGYGLILSYNSKVWEYSEYLCPS